jgi:hypothetical protein
MEITNRAAGRLLVASATLVTLLAGGPSAIFALQVPDRGGRFDSLILEDPGASVGVATTPLDSLPVSEHARARWEGFRANHGPDWKIHLDRRSGAPLLVEGKGIPWSGAQGATAESLAASLRTFIAGSKTLLLADDAELVFDAAASGKLADDVWQIVFGRAIAGIPVAGERYLFTIGHGNLISFGSPRWSRIDASPVPALAAVEAKERLTQYMTLTAADAVTVVETPALQFIPLRAAPAHGAAPAGPYAGPLGAGYASALVWKVAVRVEGQQGTWVGLVDAATGAIRSFVDDDRYARVKGGVYPISNDQTCPDGCEQPNYSMPFADVMVGATPATTNTFGTFNCSPAGSIATTTLSGQYVRVLDQCGPISQSIACSADINLSVGPGTDCSVPAGSSAGNTHAARSSFYHLNRIAEHARTWLPTVSWLNNQLTDNVNISQTCNAVWNGSAVNFYRSGGGCNNTGEIAAVLLHEWGHGLDQNDGGGFDNPSESYADVTAIMSLHVSCLGRGFRQFSNCGGYGNTCLNCTGVRDLDWDQRADHVPSTPAGFVMNRCPGGSGPCGREVHCEGYVAAETLWDLAVRDLPASGLDANSAWNLADKLWYKSRLGSGDDAYNCSLPNSDGCSASSWFQKIRAVDDDDGNLANGTPHAAAIFAAFDRHKIACGAASDTSNQNSNTCPVMLTPTLTGVPGSTTGTVALSWTPVPNAISYRVLRNDSGCESAFTRITNQPGTSYTDGALPNGLPFYYSVQAMATNSACDGGVSNCQAITPQPFAGLIKLDADTYGCSSLITVTMTDGNVGAPPTAALRSTTEGTAETVVLTRIAPGSTTYRGTITTTANPAASDGLLSVRNGDTITATYIDSSDGGGGLNIPRVASASASCPAAGVRPVADGSFGTAMKGSRANSVGSIISVTWDVSTCSSADHHILYGNLADVASTTVSGSFCDLGTSGNVSWTDVPAGDLWFVVVGDDDAATEGSWGTDGSGAQRGSGTASGMCGLAALNTSGACP